MAQLYDCKISIFFYERIAIELGAYLDHLFLRWPLSVSLKRAGVLCSSSSGCRLRQQL